jgi:hypothetical protein
MEQPPHVELPTANVPPPLPPTTSLAARLLNVFATPGEVFEEVAATPTAVKNWLVPTLIACVVAVVSIVILFSQPAIQQQIREQQQAAMDKNVKAGKMTQADADKAMEVIQKFSGPTVLAVTGGLSAIFMTFGSVFLWAFGLWLVGMQAFKSEVRFMKAVEVVSLAGMVSALGEIVNLLLRVNLGKQSSSVSLALVVGEFDAQNPVHVLLALLDLFVLWHLIVLSVGFSRLTRIPFARVLLVLGLIWFTLRILLGASSIIWMKMFT